MNETFAMPAACFFPPGGIERQKSQQGLTQAHKKPRINWILTPIKGDPAP